YSLQDLAGDAGAQLVADALAEVRSADRVAVLESGATLGYDALLVAVGARPQAPFPGARVLGTDPEGRDLDLALAALRDGRSRSIAFVVPPGVSWTLPAYELALLTSAELRSMGVGGARIVVASPEERPLALFGPAASEAVEELLGEAGVAFRGLALASMEG